MRDEFKRQRIAEFVSKSVRVFEGENLENYRKYKPHYARMLERGTAIIRKCEKCDDAYVIAKYRDGVKNCWPCYSGEKFSMPKNIQAIIENLYQEWYNYIHQGVKITKL